MESRVRGGRHHHPIPKQITGVPSDRTCYGRTQMSDDQAPFSFRIESGAVDGASIIVIDGELDLASAPHLVEATTSLAEGREPVILDLSSVTFVDSSGVRALLDVERIVGDKGRRLALFRPGVGVTRLLDLVDLRSRFTEVEALDRDTLLALHRV